MYLYAQTNLQLYNQLIKADYSEPDLACVAKGYELAMKLFSGRYRANGKPFLAHLIGTASILAGQSSPAHIVVAGLLHAAYMQGDFGDRHDGITEARQAYVAQAVGDQVEAVVAHYTSFVWNTENIFAIRDKLSTLDQATRQVLLIRLANELEDHLDFGMLYCKKDQHARKKTSPNLLVEVAKGLGHPALADWLADVFRETATTNIPSVLCRKEKVSFVNAPILNQSSARSFKILKLIEHLLPGRMAAKLMSSRMTSRK